jgi:hypothetical protein
VDRTIARQQALCRPEKARKRRLRLGRAIAFPLYRTTTTETSYQGLHWIARKNEQFQRLARNLLPKMVFHDRPVYQVEHAAQLIMARKIDLRLKAEYICAELSFHPLLFTRSPATDHTFQGVSLGGWPTAIVKLFTWRTSALDSVVFRGWEPDL